MVNYIIEPESKVSTRFRDLKAQGWKSKGATMGLRVSIGVETLNSALVISVSILFWEFYFTFYPMKNMLILLIFSE